MQPAAAMIATVQHTSEDPSLPVQLTAAYVNPRGSIMAAIQKRLTRLPASGRIAAVCSGLSDYFEVDVTLVRLAWVVLSIVPGASSAA
jgi:hypothetical protein